MEKSRLDAFSDGFIPIILMIMVLDLKAPREHSFESSPETIDRRVLVANGLLYGLPMAVISAARVAREV